MEKSILLSLVLCGTMSLPLQAQSEYENPNWKESETKMATAQVLTFEMLDLVNQFIQKYIQ